MRIPDDPFGFRHRSTLRAHSAAARSTALLYAHIMNTQGVGINVSPDAPPVPPARRLLTELLVLWVLMVGVVAAGGAGVGTALSLHQDTDTSWFWSVLGGVFAGLGAGTVFFVTGAALGLLAEIADSTRYVMFRSAGYRRGELD